MAQAFRSTRVVTPSGVAPLTVIVEGERIAAIRGWADSPAGVPLRDFGDLVLMPGLVDTHVHLNEPGRTDWEGFYSGTRAAAAGGVTTLVDMPLNCIPEVISRDALEAKRAAASGRCRVDWAAWGGVVRGNADCIEPLVSAGVPGFKCFLIDSGIDTFTSVRESDLRMALAHLRGTNLPLLAHAESPAAIGKAVEQIDRQNPDWRNYLTYLASRPDDAEVEAIALLIRMAEEFQTPIHVVHLSSAKALPLLAGARNRGVPITVETCIHYLWFAAEEIPSGATEYKCAPPIRSAANREELWNALFDGLIDFVASDHSPCPPEMKHREEGKWSRAWGGIASLGLVLPVLWTGTVQRGLDEDAALLRVSNWLSAGPARLASMSSVKGAIRVGAHADLVAFDPDAQWVVEVGDLYFRHKLSPYVGAKLRGRVTETWLRGSRIFSHGEFEGAPIGREWVIR